MFWLAPKVPEWETRDCSSPTVRANLFGKRAIDVEHRLVDAISELLAKEVLHPVSNPAVGKFCIVQVAHLRRETWHIYPM